MTLILTGNDESDLGRLATKVPLIPSHRFDRLDVDRGHFQRQRQKRLIEIWHIDPVVEPAMSPYTLYSDKCSTKPKGFLELPVEIRLIIYERLVAIDEGPFCKLQLQWIYGPNHGRSTASKWKSTRSHRCSTRSLRIASFLRSCRKVHEEAQSIAWRATEVDLVGSSTALLSFVKDARKEFLYRLRFLKVEWEMLLEAMQSESHDDRGAYHYLCKDQEPLRLRRLHATVENNSNNAIFDVRAHFIALWHCLTDVEIFAVEWTSKSRGRLAFEYEVGCMKAKLRPAERLTVQYDATDYNYEYPTLIVSWLRDSSLNDQPPDPYPFVDRIGDNSDVE